MLLQSRPVTMTTTKQSAWGEVQTEHCTDFDAHKQKRQPTHIRTSRARKKVPSVKPRQAKIKARTKTPNNEERYVATCLSTPKTYVWHNKLCNTLSFFFFLVSNFSENSFPNQWYWSHTPKRNSREEEEEEPPQSEEGIPSRQRSTIPAYIFF